MQALQYRAEVASEEQEGDGPERDQERGDLVLGLVVVVVPDLGAERVVVWRIASNEVAHDDQQEEQRSKE
jgi:hypothetical protein